MNRQQLFYGLDFQNQRFTDDDVQPITAIQTDTLVHDRERQLPSVADLRLSQLQAQSFFVCGFEQPRTERTMDIDRKTNHAFAQRIAIGGIVHLLSVSSVPLW